LLSLKVKRSKLVVTRCRNSLA